MTKCNMGGKGLKKCQMYILNDPIVLAHIIIQSTVIATVVK